MDSCFSDELIFRQRVPMSQFGNNFHRFCNLIQKKNQNKSTTLPLQVLAGYLPPPDHHNHNGFSNRKRKREQHLCSSSIAVDDWSLNSVLIRGQAGLTMDTGQPDLMVRNGSCDYEIGGPAMMIDEEKDDWSLNSIVRSAGRRRMEEDKDKQVLFDVNVDEERPLTTETSSDHQIVVTSVDSGSSGDQELESAVTYLPIVKHSGGGDMKSDSEGVVSQQDCGNRVTKSHTNEAHSLLPIAKQGGAADGSMSSVSKVVVSASVTKCGPHESEPEGAEGLGASLTDSLTAEEIKHHLSSFSQFRNLGSDEDIDTCQLCYRKKLSFAPPPMDCASCGHLIKGSSGFYRTPIDMVTPYYFCITCKNASGGRGSISVRERELSFPKEQLVKIPAAEGLDEPWVLCDGCQRWQHQTCALYNDRLDLEKEMKYTCPYCRLAELEAGKHTTLTAPLGAGDLPRTFLGDHIEQRLVKSLAREKMQRAQSLGKSPEEVPGVEDLAVRVVVSVDKQINVKQPFLDTLQGNTYPSEFPYKSKVILLFQKVDAVEVCLFAMYVQEFGSECGQPNKGTVYISYLDSVRYFTPDVKTVTGLPLRTFVYHEVLVGYLDYCKKRGFSTGYIWACPPLKGDDYILYCHPKTQKNPKTGQLRKWYKTMLKKALDENVVTEWTNFYDRFFVPKDNHIRITVARLPYFDGSYWNAAIEQLMVQMEKEAACAGDAQKKAKKISKRTLKAMGHDALSDDSVKDAEVMQKLGERMHSMKDDFIVVHLQHICKNCHETILSGSRWSCNKCSNYNLCTRCLDAKQNPDGSRTHATIHGEKHLLSQIPVSDVVVDTKDKDDIIESDIFESRHTFLNFCQARNYQFDTILHAKHSTMMILYQLHNKSPLTTVNSCSICHQQVPVRWQCETCSGFYTCEACYQKQGDGCHVHKLSKQHLVKSHCRTKSKNVLQQKRARQPLPTALDVLSHASQCRTTMENPCLYPRCLDMKKLFHHYRTCSSHGLRPDCKLCKKVWHLLLCHSQICKDSNCKIPRCKDIKEKLRAQSEAQQQAQTVVILD